MTVLRTLARSPGYVLATVASLALGIGASVAAFGVIDAIRLRTLPFPSADRLLVLSEVPRSSPGGPNCALECDVSYETFSQRLSNRSFQTLDAVAGFTSGGKVWMSNGEPVPVSGGVVSPNVFSLMRATPFLGRTLKAEDNQLGVGLVTVLSHAMWSNLLGADSGVVGKAIKLSDSQYTVVGVMPPGFDFEAGSQFWLPAVPTLDPSTRPSIKSLTVLGRLAPGRTLSEARAELAAVELPTQSGGGGRVEMTLEARAVRERYTTAAQSHDVIFAVMVGCLMLLGCANLANLSLVRALDRRREFALRATLGASRRRLALDVVGQHAVLVVTSTLLGLVVAQWLFAVLGRTAALAALRPSGMTFQLDARAMAFASLLSLVVGAVLSIAPVRVATAPAAGLMLRDELAAGVHKNWAQQGFVVAQIAAAFALLCAGGLLAHSALQIARVPLGFDPTRVVEGSPSYPHPWRVREKYMPVTQGILDQLAVLPGAQEVGLRAQLPLRGAAGGAEVSVDGAAPLAPTLVPRVATSVSPKYFDALGIRLRRGRVFGGSDVAGGVPVAIVNEWAAAKWWPNTDPIGHTVRVDSASGVGVALTIVGVVANNRAAQPRMLFAESGPELYRPYVQAPSAFPSFVVRSEGDPAGLLRPVRDVFVRSVPDRPLFATLTSNIVGDQLAGVRSNASQAMWIAAIGMVMALIGVYSMVAYSVRRRTREIGIRCAVGASKHDLARLILGDVVLLVLVGLAIGVPVARATSGVLATLLHGTSPTQLSVFALVAVGVLALALAGAAWPFAKALRADPVEALRAEPVRA